MKSNGVYEIGFGANVSSATAATPVQLSVQVGGVTLPETTMISTPETADALNHIYTETFYKNYCGYYDRVTIVNTGTAPITVGANPVLKIRIVS